MIIPAAPAHVTMSEWNIIVIIHEGKTIEKFLGYCLNDYTYRISSQVVEYDAEKNVVGLNQGQYMSSSMPPESSIPRLKRSSTN